MHKVLSNQAINLSPVCWIAEYHNYAKISRQKQAKKLAERGKIPLRCHDNRMQNLNTFHKNPLFLTDRSPDRAIWGFKRFFGTLWLF